MQLEIERKFIIQKLPDNLSSYPSHKIEQGYLNSHPTVRIRKEDDQYYLTYKSGGGLVHEEYNLPLDEPSYLHLREKCDGLIITKTRYLIPYQTLTIELDVFDEPLAPLLYAEIEFPSEEDANKFIPLDWFVCEVTGDKRYSNASLSRDGVPVVPI